MGEQRPANARQVWRQIAPDHPCLPGHFPGHPIVPAVLLLDEVRCAAAAFWPELAVIGVPQVKFLRSLAPAERFCLRLWPAGSDRLAFECRHADAAMIATGRLAVRG